MTMSKNGKTFTYVSGKKYDHMIARCYRKKDKDFERYGKRGIRVCEDWIRDISKFRAWLIVELEAKGISIPEFIQYSGRYHLDRLNGEGHYVPSNCRIASPQQNARNKKGTKYQVFISSEGKHIQLSET